MKNQSNSSQMANKASLITFAICVALMLLSMYQANQAFWAQDEALRENYLYLFTFSFVMALYSCAVALINRK